MFCPKCGKEIMDEAVICPHCGCATKRNNVTTANSESGLKIAAKVFMIIGTIVLGLSCFLIPLAWCIPLTTAYFRKVEKGEPISTGFKVCCLLFVSLIGGVLMLCDND